MPIEQSYLDKEFTVADPDARIRNDDLLTFATYKQGQPLPPGAQVGGVIRIPPGTRVKATAVRTIGLGSATQQLFAQAAPAAGGA
jgi:hypothetical protein